jgi:hypothetical protein
METGEAQMMTRKDVEAALGGMGFTDIGQIDKSTRAWLARQRKSGAVVSVGWSIFGRNIWGWA